MASLLAPLLLIWMVRSFSERKHFICTALHLYQSSFYSIGRTFCLIKHKLKPINGKVLQEKLPWPKTAVTNKHENGVFSSNCTFVSNKQDRILLVAWTRKRNWPQTPSTNNCCHRARRINFTYRAFIQCYVLTKRQYNFSEEQKQKKPIALSKIFYGILWASAPWSAWIDGRYFWRHSIPVLEQFP